MKNAIPKIIFCPILYDDVDNDIKGIKNPNPISGHRFQTNIIKGLISNNADISIINIPRIRSFPNSNDIIVKKKAFVFDGNNIGMSIGFINLPVISRITKRIAFWKALRNEIRKNRKRDCVLMTFNTYDIQSGAFFGFKKKNKNIYTCDIIADLHGKYGIKNPARGIRGFFINRVEKRQDAYAKKFDKYVLLTEAMKSVVGADKKPYVIVEGLYEFEEKENDVLETIDNKTKKILYAGSLSKEYGIEHLLRAFSMIIDDSYRLIIVGAGNGEQIVNKYVLKDSRIEYKGYISPSEVQELQRDATVLISPRQTNQEFVKYSFPSKTMESLASGKPYIAHKLPCEPEEYGEYIQYPANESDESLRDEIVRVCELSQQQRNEIGLRAKKFIMEEKNPHRMCRRIIDMLCKKQ